MPNILVVSGGIKNLCQLWLHVIKETSSVDKDACALLFSIPGAAGAHSDGESPNEEEGGEEATAMEAPLGLLSATAGPNS